MRRLGLLAALSVLLAGCFEGWRQPVKSPTSAVWLGAGTAPPATSAVARLAELGIRELFVEAGRLDGRSGSLERLPLAELPPGTATTLIIGGPWPSDLGQGDVDAFATRLAEEARQLRFTAEGRGLIPVGIHLQPSGIGDLERYGAALARLRRHLDRSLFLSASIERLWLDDPAVEKVTDAVDFVVAFLYGQLPREPEDSAAWDFVRLEQRLQQLDAAGVRTMIGVITLGTATWLGKDGTVRDRTTQMALPTLLWDRRLALRPGFSLEGVNRQVYNIAVERPATIGGWKLTPGEEIRVIRPVTSHIEELLRHRGAWNFESLLGMVYYRVPRPGESLSLRVDNLLAGLDPSPASPVLDLSVSLQRGTGRGWLFRATVVNRSSEVTELSLMDSNWLEVATDRGIIGKVEVGDFYRFVLFRSGANGAMQQTFRSADTVRLYMPLLEGEQTLTSGDIEILSPGREPVLTLRGGFSLTDGRTLELGPVIWRRGRMIEPAPAGTGASR